MINDAKVDKITEKMRSCAAMNFTLRSDLTKR